MTVAVSDFWLFGIAPGGACHAVHVTMNPVGSYPTFALTQEIT
jgi:hypothetical protein